MTTEWLVENRENKYKNIQLPQYRKKVMTTEWLVENRENKQKNIQLPLKVYVNKRQEYDVSNVILLQVQTNN